MTELNNKSFLILGLGHSGLAMARWCAREGARFAVADSRATPPCRATLLEEFPDTKVHLGDFSPALLEEVDVVAISPGLALNQGPQADLLDSARQRGIPVWGEIELFARKLASLKQTQGYAPDVIAITGTNGKTTVTSLTGKLCKRAGLSTRVAGNIGPPALDALAEAIDDHALPAVWVLELSSFQLETTRSLAPRAATVLNISQDHLDWHGSHAAYSRAKARVFEGASCAVLNRADPAVMALKIPAPASFITFGMDSPKDAECFGIVRDKGVRWLVYAQPLEVETQRRLVKSVARNAFVLKRLMPLDALKIQGDHNALNALAALALCHALGLPLAPLLHGLRAYQGEPHRVERIASIDGVDYIDDSKGTNVGATVAALEGLGRRVVLIAGGDGKGQDFSPLAAPVVRHARAVFLIGKDAAKIRSAIANAVCNSEITLADCSTLEEAVRAASEVAHAGDAVLLSPACASLDMFRDYRHRADVFAAAVARLSAKVPAPC